MPIRPENRKRYPPNWKREIVPAIRISRAANRCEWINPEAGERCTERHMEPNAHNPRAKSPIRLTVAHKDHMPENCDPANLAAWCELHHTRYDAPMKAATKRAKRKGVPIPAHIRHAGGRCLACGKLDSDDRELVRMGLCSKCLAVQP